MLVALLAVECLPALAAPVEALNLKDTKPTIRILIPNSVEDYSSYPTALDIESITGYHAEYDMLPADNANDKLNLIMAAQEDYDIIQAGSPDLIMQYAREGAVTELSQFFGVAPNLAAALNTVERAAYTLDGGIYGIGMQSLFFKDDEGNYLGEIRELPFYRKDWADTLGIAMPTTIDEFTDMLRAFKTYDNGTGVPTIPMTADTNMQISGILGAFGVPNGWNVVDGKLENRVTDPRFKEYLAYMKSLFAEGLLDNEFPANKGANKMERYASGAAGVAYFGYWDTPALYDAMTKTQPDHQTQVLAPLEGPHGRAIGSSVGGFDRNAFVPAVTKNLDDVINYINLKLDVETQKIITIGYEGVDYYMKGEEYWPILPTFFDHRGASNFYTGRYSDYYPTWWLCRARKDERQYANWEYMNYSDEVAPYNETTLVGMAPTFESVALNLPSLNTMLNDELVKVIAGEHTLTDYDAFVVDWLAAGGQEMIDEYNTWWAGFELK